MTRFEKARSEVNLAENTLGRALYALDKLKEEMDSGPVASVLPPLDISEMRLWDFSDWHASEWDNGFSNIPWKAAAVQWQSDDSVLFALNSVGAPELQAPDSALKMVSHWQADVTLPEQRSGVCVAPLWLYSKSTGKKGEIDFEFTKDGLVCTIHSEHTGSHKQLAQIIPGFEEWGGKRYLFGITADIDAGVIEMLVDGELVHTFNRADQPDAFPAEPLKTFISMWTAKAGLGWVEGWLGKFTPLAKGERLAMMVHGYSDA